MTVASKRWWLTVDGRKLVPDGSPDAYQLALAPGMVIPEHLRSLYDAATAKKGKRPKKADVPPPETAAGEG